MPTRTKNTLVKAIIFIAVLVASSVPVTLHANSISNNACETEPGHISNPLFSENLNQISKAAENATAIDEVPPFAKACQKPGALSGRPKTGLFQRFIPPQDAKGRRTDDFLKRVGQSVLSSMADEELKLSVREDCLKKRLPADDIGCKHTRAWLQNELVPLVKEARMNLALAQTTGQVATLMKKTTTTLNSKLDNLGTHKEVDWSRLTTSEVITAGEILGEYRSEMREATAQEVREKRVLPENAAKFENDGLLAARFTNGLAYVEILSQNPILQYLSSPHPLEHEVAAAITKMRENLRSDRAVAEDALKNTKEPSGLRLLDYASHVEAELLKTPEDCGLATSLLKVKESRSLGNTLAIGVPLAVVSIALPIAGQVAAGVALGAASGAGYSVYTYYDKNSARERFISHLKTDDMTEYERLDRADREFKISLAMGPAAMALSPALRVVSLGVRAAKIGTGLSRTSRVKTTSPPQSSPSAK